MSKPVTHAFFVGRATAEAIVDRLEDTLTDFLSAVGKFDAERREDFRNFTEAVMSKTVRVETTAAATYGTGYSSADLQELIDNLRAEVAHLKSELQQYREQNGISQ
ncbi:hypothetical protein Pse7367_1851 [Thalassoporum mexicanum PCC 7367]|uniref:DUF6825 family protein n=1 Tax=Thalassoporum mexicanum TaxID=3457544 RepID=UPI00029FFCD0|nr:hypothetical protein [Pseudanabaena sp. PCC 7367]AFY70127.1 hypothetical protein Pse7367_1851 [Pseudanabaena sp. PCC 7367]